MSQKVGLYTKSVIILLQEAGLTDVTPESVLADLAKQAGKIPAELFNQIASDERAYK